MAWFKSKEEKKREKEELEGRVKAYEDLIITKQQYDSFLAKVVITPENKEEYEKRVGYTVDVINTGNNNIGVVFRSYADGNHTLANDLEKNCLKLKKNLIEAGIEAIIEANLAFDGYRAFFYGLPVARKKGGPYR